MDPDSSTEIPELTKHKKRNRHAYRPTIREAVLMNAALPEKDRLTHRQIAEKLGVRIASVYVAMSNLRGEKVLTPKESKPAKDIPGPMAMIDHSSIAERMLESALGKPLEQAVQEAATDGVMAKEERAQRLSQIGRLAPSNVSVLAVKALEEMERGSGLAVGPPDPMDSAARAERLAKIQMACGINDTFAAIKLCGWLEALAKLAAQAIAVEESAPAEELRG